MAKKNSGNKVSPVLMVIGGIVLVIIVLALIIGGWVAGTYNSFVKLDEGVNTAWGSVQTAYQRRADLVPNLVATVKASSDFETGLQTKVAELRSGISTAKSPSQMDAAGAQINTLIQATFEAYPEIKSTAGYQDLQVQLEGTENRIKVDRDSFNAVVKDFNIKVRTFPTAILAGMFGFTQKEYFASSPGSENAPDVGGLFNK